MDYQVDIDALCHDDKCRHHDDYGFCDCGAVEGEKLRQCEAHLAEVEQEREDEKDAALQSVGGEEIWRYWYRQFLDMRHERDEFKESYRLAMVSVNDAYDKGKAAAEQDRDRLAAEVERLKTKEPGKFIAEIEHEYAVKTNNLIERHAAQLATTQEENKRLKEKVDYSTEVDLRMHKRHDDLYEQHEILKGELATKCANCSHKNAFDQLTALEQENAELRRERDELMGVADANPLLFSRKRLACLLAIAEKQLASALEEVERLKNVTQPAANLIGKLAREVEDLKAQQSAQVEWLDGEPPFPWCDEWFIAVTTYGDKVVLTALPKEHTYDYKTADNTYFKADKIAKWAQFPDSEYVSYVQQSTQEQFRKGMERACEIAMLWRCLLPSTCCDNASDAVCLSIRNEIHEEIRQAELSKEEGK